KSRLPQLFGFLILAPSLRLSTFLAFLFHLKSRLPLLFGFLTLAPSLRLSTCLAFLFHLKSRLPQLFGFLTLALGFRLSLRSCVARPSRLRPRRPFGSVCRMEPNPADQEQSCCSSDACYRLPLPRPQSDRATGERLAYSRDRIGRRRGTSDA